MNSKKMTVSLLILLVVLTGCSKEKEEKIEEPKIEIQNKTFDIVTDEKVPSKSVTIEEEVLKYWKNKEGIFINYSAKITNENKRNILIRDLTINFLDEKNKTVKKVDIALITPDIIEYEKTGFIGETIQVTEEEYKRIKKGKATFENSFTYLKPIELEVVSKEVIQNESGDLEVIKGVFKNNREITAKDIRIVSIIYTKNGKKSVLYGTLYQMYSGVLKKGQEGYYELKYPELPSVKMNNIEKIDVYAYEWVGE